MELWPVYYIFWFIMSLIGAILGIIGLLYLFSLLQDIKQGIHRIETLLSVKSTKEKRRK